MLLTGQCSPDARHNTKVLDQMASTKQSLRPKRLAWVLSLALVGCAGWTDPSEEGGAPTGVTDAAPDIVDVAAATGEFQQFLAAVEVADLTDMLRGEGPFTVFAPSDDAFARLPSGTLEELLQPANQRELVAVLKYHIVPGAITFSDIAGEATTLETLEGGVLDIDAVEHIKVNAANMKSADIEASNGVIHQIDAVLLPE